MERFQRARAALAHANDPVQIARVVRDCVGSLPDYWIAALPLTAQSIVRDPAADVASAAIDILQAEMRCSAGHETVTLLHELAVTYAVAAARLAQVSPRSVKDSPKT